MNLFNNLGFSGNPFSKRSSEQELDFISEIFYEPNYYSTLVSDLASGDTRFVIGQRGHGKSSIVNKLFEDLELMNNILVVKIDRYDSIPLKNNEIDLLLIIIRKLVTKLSLKLLVEPKLVKRLNKYEKERLSFLISMFFKSISDAEFQDVVDKIQKFKAKNFLIRLFNRFGINILNQLASSAVNVTSNLVRQSIGIEGISNDNLYREYFGNIEEFKISKQDINSTDCTKDELKNLLDHLFGILSKLGTKKTVILFDKIDEFQQLNQEVSTIANFTSEILSDNELLLNDSFSVGFSLWSELKSELSGTVRFDKFGTIDVRWTNKDMIPLINKRLKYFSKANQINFGHIIRNDFDQEEVIKLANKSPRDLISLLSEIYQEQSNRNISVRTFDDNAIRNGMLNFCRHYDYDSLFPSKVGKNKEIKSMINRLLKMKLVRFNKNNLTSAFNQTSNQSEGQIKIMKNYNLIHEEEILGSHGVIYEIIDPKVEFMIKHLVESIE